MTTLVMLLLVLPPNEAKILERVALKYRLTMEQTQLLAAIRKAEQGPTGMEFGIGQEYPGHRATRYKHSSVRSFWVQASWAAGTISKRYHGDLDAFSHVYCPKNASVWESNVRWWITKQQKGKE